MIDAHIHFFDPDRPEGITWPVWGNELRRTTLPADLKYATTSRSIDGVVAVETSRRFIDDQWLLGLAERESLIQGVVLNLQPDQPGFVRRLKLAQSNSKFCGIRMRPIAEYDLSSQRLRENLCRLSAAGHSIELGAQSLALKCLFIDLARESDRGHWILDHSGHPDLAYIASDTDWLNSMAGIAELPNVFVKVTSPYDLMPGSSEDSVRTACRSLISTLISLFGVDRLIFGSNWPVSGLCASYDRIVDLFEDSLASADHYERFFDLNARRAYQLRDEET